MGCEVGCELECDASTPSRQSSHIFQADESRSCNQALGFYFTDALLPVFLPSLPSASSVCSAEGCLALFARASSIRFSVCSPVQPHYDHKQDQFGKGRDDCYL